MLLYVFAFIFILTSLFSWRSYDDAIYQDSGESEQAAALIGFHNALIGVCQSEPGLCDSSLGPVSSATLTQAALTFLPAYASKAQAGKWTGFVALVSGTDLVTFATTANDASGDASTVTGLSSTLIIARLVEDALKAQDSVVRIGSYDPTDNAVTFQPLTGYVPKDDAVGGQTPIPASLLPEILPAGTPALVSPAYCSATQTCAAVAEQATATAVSPTTSLLTAIKGGSKDPLGTVASDAPTPVTTQIQ